MFNNARTYNQEGSWVYLDAIEMERVFDETFERVIAGTDLPGAPPAGGPGASSSSNDIAMSPVEEHRLLPKAKSGRKQVLSDDEFLTPSEEE